jgi:hypothetical protein
MCRVGVVDRGDAVAGLFEHAEGHIHVRQLRPLTRQIPFEALAFDVLHDEVRRAVELSEGVDLQHVRMADAGHGARFDEEALPEIGAVEELGADDFDGDVAL